MYIWIWQISDLEISLLDIRSTALCLFSVSAFQCSANTAKCNDVCLFCTVISQVPFDPFFLLNRMEKAANVVLYWCLDQSMKWKYVMSGFRFNFQGPFKPIYNYHWTRLSLLSVILYVVSNRPYTYKVDWLEMIPNLTDTETVLLLSLFLSNTCALR